MHATRLTGPLLVFALAVAACSGSAATGAPTAAPASVAASSAATNDASAGGYGKGGSPAAAGGAAAVALGTTGLGTVLVDGKGMTLYVYLPDTATTSACTGSCLTNWSPLPGDTPTLGAGLTAGDFASITRADGTKQVTFHGHPLYTFANDTAAGQTNGQGLLGKWYVIDADGQPHIL